MINKLTPRLTYAASVTILTCAFFSFSFSSSTASPQEIIIEQVTDKHTTTHPNNLIGTVTELQFKSFIQRFEKNYSTHEEYVHRLGVFAKNMIRAAEHQAMDPTAVHGVTIFSDLTEEEFQTMYMGVKGSVSRESMGDGGTNSAAAAAVAVDITDLPEEFDWREKGAVTEVKMQGTCGSCWAFSTTGVLEGANFIATGKLLTLSEQQLVDCDHACDSNEKDACDNGCSGGLMTNAYKYLIEAGGIEESKSYSYTGKQGECKFNPNRIAVKVVNFTTIPVDESQIAAHLVHQGPLAIGLNAIFMQTYIGGVSCPLICGKRSMNHGVLLVGYGSTDGFSILRLRNKPYWIIKNSWGTHWGEHGYYRVCRGYNMCGMNTMVSFAVTN